MVPLREKLASACLKPCIHVGLYCAHAHCGRNETRIRCGIRSGLRGGACHASCHCGPGYVKLTCRPGLRCPASSAAFAACLSSMPPARGTSSCSDAWCPAQRRMQICAGLPIAKKPLRLRSSSWVAAASCYMLFAATAAGSSSLCRLASQGPLGSTAAQTAVLANQPKRRIWHEPASAAGG